MTELGPHAGFILAAHAATAVVIGGLLLRAVLTHRAQIKALARFEAADRQVANADAAVDA